MLPNIFTLLSFSPHVVVACCTKVGIFDPDVSSSLFTPQLQEMASRKFAELFLTLLNGLESKAGELTAVDGHR